MFNFKYCISLCLCISICFVFDIIVVHCYYFVCFAVSFIRVLFSLCCDFAVPCYVLLFCFYAHVILYVI